MLYYELIVLGLACLAAPITARLAGFETHRKPFDLVGAGGVFFLLGASLSLAGMIFTAITELCSVLMMISFVLGWIGLLIGAFWITSEVFRETNHGVLHRVEAKL
jgi:hypothetical protein